MGILAESYETILNSRKIIKEQGSTIQGSHGLKPHPEIDIAKKAKDHALAAIKQLGLEEYATNGLKGLRRDFGGW